MNKLVLVASLFLMGATVTVDDWQPKDGLAMIHVADRIAPGDVRRIELAYARAKKAGKLVLALDLDSWGGDGDAGIVLADYIANHRVKVYIGARCWSACAFPALVALGRGRLMVGARAQLGVHQAIANDTRAPDPEWTRMAAGILRRYGAPSGPLKAMVITHPDDMVTYDASDLVGMGAIRLPDGWTWWTW